MTKRTFQSHVETAQTLLRTARARYENEDRPAFKQDRLIELQTMELMVSAMRSIYWNLNK